MKFRLVRDGDYKFETGDEGNVTEITLSYVKDSRQRGIKMYVNTVTIAKAEPGSHFTSRSYDLFAGLSFHVYTLPRKSDKAMAHAAEWFSQHVDSIVKSWETSGKETTKVFLSQLIREFNDVDHPATVPVQTQGVQANGI